jgi:virginiamycin B lyase
MHSARVDKLFAALSIAGFVGLCVAPSDVRAQEPLALAKFSAGNVGGNGGPARFAPLDIVASPSGNLWASGAGSIAVISPDRRVVAFSAGTTPGHLTPNVDGNIWFTDTGTNSIGKITPTGQVTEFPVGVTPNGIAAGSDSNIWFTESTGSEIGRIRPDGTVTLFSEGISASAGIQQITAGPDGNLWFTEAGSNRVGSITPGGRVFEFGTGIVPAAGLFDITTGPDGNLWFTETATATVGQITPAGVITEFPTNLSADSGPFVIAAGPDGNLWLGEQNANRFARMTTGGTVMEFLADIPNLTTSGSIAAIARGPGNTIWFTQTGSNNFNRITLAPPSSLVASILPGGRTVAPGAPATVFATMLNGGPTALSNCQVGLPADAPVSLHVNYQATVPATNAPTGPLNTPFALGAGAAQTLLLTFDSAPSVFAPGLAVNFSCSGATAASTEGVNTADLYFSSLAVPDDIVLAASATPGTISVPVEGSNAFGVAMINAGGSGTGAPTMVSVDTGLATLPVTVTVCMTVPATGACLEPPQQHQFFKLPAGSTSTFSVFVSATAAVPFDPSNNRVFIRFIEFDDTQNAFVSRGSASVALKAQ